MSGFVGLLNLDGAPAGDAWLAPATSRLAFRGPDAQQVWQDGPVGFGCALLRTTDDTAPEAQPCTLDGQTWIVADARVDDRAALIARLRSHGCSVAPQAPDVELLLHAYAAWGTACVDHLTGDFAFAMWDGRQHELFCARDHFGVAPFYYGRTGSTLLFSNTLNALRLHPGVPDTLDEQAIGHFLLFNQRPASDITTFAAIRRLPPAHTLQVSGGTVRLARYWDVPDNVRIIRPKDPRQVVEGFRTVFAQAVGDRLRCKQVGTALSGGLDSTSIAATAHRHLQATAAPFELRGATIVYSRLIPDQEGDFARLVAEKSGFPTHVYVAEDYITRDPEWAPSYMPPEPWAISGTVAEEDIVRDTAQHAQVYLMGFGGDPLFSPLRVGMSAAMRMGDLETILRTARRSAGAVRRAWRGRNAEPDFPAWLNQDFVRRTKLRTIWEERPAASPWHDHFRGMAYDALWENIFMVADPGFTGLPVKARFPFFDLRLFTFMQTVAPDPWCRSKRLLREAMRGVLPDAVLERPKTALQGRPHHRLLQERGIPEWMRTLAVEPQLDAYVDRQTLFKMIEAQDHVTPAILSSLHKVLALAYWFHGQLQMPVRPLAGEARAAVVIRT